MTSLPITLPPAFGDRQRLTCADQTPRPQAASSTEAAPVWAGRLGLWTQFQRHLTRSRLALSHLALSQRTAVPANDGLTGLPSRRTLHEQIQATLSARSQTGTQVQGRGQNQQVWSLLLIDIDHFQSVNDVYGRQAGDEVLRAMTTALRAELRQFDVLGRWGGEEFMALLPGTPFEGALVAAERLRRAVSLRTFPYAGSVTVSIGVASFLHGDTAERVVARADAGMYAAKRAGRNRVAFTE